MRDYSFGNFISALRMRRGLSQYQLGALVGVSDKAVSKWENGVSKPRTTTIVKLAQILNVGTDELLACKYAAFDGNGKDLFAMDHEIIRKAKSRMTALYGENPPLCVRNRFLTEERMLKGQMALRWIGFFGMLHDVLYEQDSFFLVRGAQTGSFLAWLLGGVFVNPLPPHYYCPACKRVEFIPDAACGLDAPDRCCSCGAPYEKDGFDIDAIHLYPLSNNSEITLSRGALPSVRDCITAYFGSDHKLCEVRIHEREEESLSRIVCFVLLPRELASQYPQSSLTLPYEEFHNRFHSFDRLMVVEDEKLHISFRQLSKTRFTEAEVHAYAKHATESDAFHDSLRQRFGGEDDLNAVLSTLSAPCFSDLLALSGFLHGTGAWEENGNMLYANGLPLRALISNREDVYAYLYKKLSGICPEPSGLAFEIKEALRLGRYARGQMPAETERLLLESGIPDWYTASMKKIRYLFPKAHLAAYLKLDICRFLCTAPGTTS